MATTQITGTQIADGSLTGADVADGTIDEIDLTAAVRTKLNGFTLTVVTVTANYVIPATTGETAVLVDASGGPVAVTLPTAVSSTGRYRVKKIDSTPNAATVNTTSSQTLDGGLTLALTTQYLGYEFLPASGNWTVF